MHRVRQFLPRLPLLLVALLLCCAGTAHAQRLSVFEIDTSNFPLMAAKFIILDEQGNFIRDLGPGDLVVAEDGTLVDASFTYDCPPTLDTIPASTALVCDRSGSMSVEVNGVSRLDLLKDGVRSFIQTTRFNDRTTAAIIGFDDYPIVISDFTGSANRLLTLVNRLTPGSGTAYTPAFLDPLAGGISLLKQRPASIRRILIFITDGRPSIDSPTEVQKIIDAAKQANVTIYTITLAMTMPDELETIARETGGVAYNDVTTADQMRGIYATIALRSQEIKPCVIRWVSTNGCGEQSRFRDLSVVYRPRGWISHTPFTAPARSVISLQTTPKYMWFGAITPPDSSTRPLTIKAIGSAMKIDSGVIAPDGPYSIVDWGGSPPPFTLQIGESRTLLLKFKPADSTLRSAGLQFFGAPCPYPPIILSGGFGGDVMVGDYLRLLSPIGGESYGECDTIPIRWEGARPSDSILIEVSTDNGVSWSRLTTATGLFHPWRPAASGSGYRVRISKLATKAFDTINTIAGGGALLTDGEQGLSTLMIDPTALALDGSTLYFAETGRSIVRKIDLVTGIVTTVAGTGGAGYSGDGGMATQARLANPTGLALFGGVLYITDYSNHRVREVDLATGVINTIAGTGESGFSGDGGPATSAMLQYPARVAFINNAIYISDAGNNRIRKVDLGTHRISTIAGGGTYVDGDGSLATLVKLDRPLGLATHFDPAIGLMLYIVEEGRHRVRRVVLNSNVITTIAGTGTAGFNGDGREAVTAELNKPNSVVAIGNRIYISDGGNQRVRYVDRTTKLIHTIAGTGRTAPPLNDGGSALLANLDGPAGIAGTPERIYIADSRTGRIREVRIGFGGDADSSRASFTVAIARLSIGIQGKQLDFGSLATNATRDTMVVQGICNTGNLPLRADSAVIVGANAGDFQIVSGPSSAPVAPGSCNPLELRFAPKGLGTRRAMAILFGGCGGADTVLLTGTGVIPCGQQTLPLVDFGTLIAGARKDSVIQQAICNNGRDQIDGRVAIVPADGAFSVIGGGGLFSLDPGECHTVTIRFSPTASGVTSSLLDYGISAECGVAATTLHGRGIAPQELYTALRVEYPADPCEHGARDTTLELFNLGDAPLVITDAEVIANNEGFSLLPPLPSNASPLVIPPGGTGSIMVRFDPAGAGAKSARVRLMSNSIGMVDVEMMGRNDSAGIFSDPSLLIFDGRLPATRFPYDSFAVVRNTGTVPIVISGGTIAGTDGTKFDLPATQFPITIAPGDSARIAVRALEPTPGRGYSATLSLAATPWCDTSDLVIDLFEGGALPAIATSAPRFRDLLCEDEMEHDTTIVIRNPGGSPLTIDGFEIRGDGRDHFIFAPSLPVVIPPGGEMAIPIRFRPLSSGVFGAELVLRSDAASGDSVVELNGRRDRIAIALLQSRLDLGSVRTGVQATGNVIVRNNGNVPATIAIPASAGLFRSRTPGTITLEPGEEYSIEVLFETSAPGVYLDTLRILETRCGIPLDLALAADAERPIRTTLSLPVDSAGPGDRALLPIRIAIDDRALFDAKGGAEYTTTIRFSGAVLTPKGAIGAVMTDNGYDPVSAVQSITLRGRYEKGDTLALIECMVPATDSLRTPLEFLSFTWSDASIAADTVNGLFTISDECYDIATVETRPRVLKIRPTPVGEEGAIEIAIDAPTLLRATLVDALGHERMTIADGYYAAGSHTLPFHPGAIPSGLYSIVIATPYGGTAAKVLVVR